MFRSFGLVIVLAVDLLGCGRQTSGSVDTMAASAQSNGTAAQTTVGRWKAGVHYETLASPQSTTVDPSKIEVVEVFWYGCSHCYTLEPQLVLWNQSKPDYIQFARIPTTWGASDVRHARLYYALQALGREDLHHEVFDTVHRRGNSLVASDDAQTLELQLAFAKAHGIGAEEFMRAYSSSITGSNLQYARQFALRHRIVGVPTMIVNGKYKTDLERVGARANDLIALVNELAASEHRRQSDGTGDT